MDTTIATGTWTVVTAHAGFTARGLFGRVPGTIPVTSGSIDIDADGRPVQLRATLDATGIDTYKTRRDNDLRGKRFLNVDAHPVIEVTADRFDRAGDAWHADAALHAVGERARLPITGTINRIDGARLHVTGTGGVDIRALGIRVPGFMVGRQVAITVTAELTHD